jgi:CDP-glycerol glycerophosphotransferase (TagB/SpsB family)
VDPGWALRGYLSTHEQAFLISYLLKFASKQPSVALIIKPHPAHKPGIVESLIDNYPLKNAFFIDKNMLPYHALNAADLLISKSSTLGVEAMLFNCPVVSCILDGEQRFNIYEGASDYIDNVEDLETLLLKLVIDQGSREKWHERHMRMQESFLAEYFCEMEEPPSVYQARVLDTYLKRRHVEEQDLCERK